MGTNVRTKTRTLLAVNAVLAGALVVLSVGAPAEAQPGNQQRPRGDYTLVSGKTSTGNANAVYILDANNHELVGLKWDAAKKTFNTIGYRNLDTDSKAQPGR